MARRRRDKTHHTPKTHLRDGFTSLAALPLQVRALSPVLYEIEHRESLPDDFRYWSPEPKRTRRPTTLSGSSAVTKSSPRATPYGYQNLFADPSSVLVCVRRGQRREVLHALRKTGRRGKKGPYRRNLWSGVHC